ncbi:MAG: aldo/keto reductase [Candidatus Dojkabacteria bacterium]|nr:aldo/keto reductase [Candidatus Dojkabacteria bacterium]
MKEALKYTKHGIVANETHYNLVVRTSEESGVVDFCNKNNILVIAYRPLRMGYFAGTEDKVLNKLADKYKMTTTQIAINYLVNKGVLPIVKSTNISHLKENIDAVNFKLSKADLEKLEEWRLPGYKTPKYDLEYYGSEKIRLVNL